MEVAQVGGIIGFAFSKEVEKKFQGHVYMEQATGDRLQGTGYRLQGRQATGDRLEDPIYCQPSI